MRRRPRIEVGRKVAPEIHILPGRDESRSGFQSPPWPHPNDKVAMAGSFCTSCPDARCDDCPLSLCPTCGTALKPEAVVPPSRWRMRLLPALSRKRISK